MHVEAPAIVATGTPPASTRTAPVIHCPVTQGGLGDPVSAHPAMTYGDASVTIGCPDRTTRGNGAAGVAWPAGGHMTPAPRGCPWRRRRGGEPGRASDDRQSSGVDVGRRPEHRDDCALAVRDHDADVADG